MKPIIMLCALFTVATTACLPAETHGSCDGGSGGLGGGGGGAGIGLECATDTDCDQTWSGECAKTQCIEGFCKEQRSSPAAACSDDLGAPGQCWGGQCCFTCLADLGDEVGAVDALDGPCMSGNADVACGFGRKLCQDCTATGQICRSGICITPECVTSDDCEDSNECTADHCVDGLCQHPTDTQQITCNAGDGQCVSGTCQANTCIDVPNGAKCLLCDLSGVCSDGICLQVEAGPPDCN